MIENVMQSTELGQLAAALAKAQAQIGGALKDKTAQVKSDKGNYSFAYADLGSVWDAIRAPLAANELAVIQQVNNDTPNRVTVTTNLVHSSGQFIRDRWSVRVESEKPQALGSAITYARRYSLSALVGVATEDDDGQAAAERVKTETLRRYEERKAKATEAKEKPAEAPAAASSPAQDDQAAKLRARLSGLWTKAKARGASKASWLQWTNTVLGDGVVPSTPEEVEQLEAAMKFWERPAEQVA